RHAAWLEPHDRHPGFDLWTQCLDNLSEQALGEREHAEIVQRATTAQGVCRDIDLVASGFEHVHCCLPYCRKKVIVKSVGPEQPLRPPGVAEAALAEPLCECLRRKGW